MKMKCKICGAEMEDITKRHITLETPTCRHPNHPYSIVMCDDCVKMFIKAVAKCGDVEFATLARHLDKIAEDLEDMECEQ